MYSLPYPPHRPPIHTLKFLTMDQLISTFWVKDIIPLKFQKQEFVFWKTHAIAYLLTWHATETFVLIHFLQRLPLYFIKDDKTKTTSSFIHFLFSCSVILRSFFLSLSLSSFPPAVGSIQPLQSQSSQSFRKGPFCRALFGGFLINHFRYCCLLWEMGT